MKSSKHEEKNEDGEGYPSTFPLSSLIQLVNPSLSHPVHSWGFVSSRYYLFQSHLRNWKLLSSHIYDLPVFPSFLSSQYHFPHLYIYYFQGIYTLIACLEILFSGVDCFLVLIDNSNWKDEDHEDEESKEEGCSIRSKWNNTIVYGRNHTLFFKIILRYNEWCVLPWWKKKTVIDLSKRLSF